MFGTEGLGTPISVQETDNGQTIKTYKRGKMTITLKHNRPSEEAVQRAGKVLNQVVLSFLDRHAKPGAA